MPVNSEDKTAAPVSNKPIPYGRQHITPADIEAVVETLKADFLTQGPKIEEFEKQFAAYIGTTYAVAVANGTAALHLCALALGVKAGDHVITTPITFAASANCVRYCGGTVAFADIDPQTGLLDLQQVRLLLESKPQGYFKGIIPVDFAGYPVDMEAFRKLADEYNLWIIEDACHAPGGYFTDSTGAQQNCGNGKFADLAIFSFHPVKHIATGEGGMITTNNPKLYEKLLMLRTHGITRDASKFVGYPSATDPNSIDLEMMGGWYMEMQTLGFNYRIPDILTALGISQLQRADEGIQRRRQIADRYDAAFANNPDISILNPATNTEQLQMGVGHAYHLYVIKVKSRKGLYDYLREHKIYAQVHYIPVHLMPDYRNLGWQKNSFPLAEAYYEQCLSLPMFPTLTEAEQVFVIEKILAFVA
jgi:UDP-4-amino-4,6-dideoxy-N-acetyl-beta-L-altrosamine transaminase